MLGGKITAQDEEEVEDELAALEAEVAGKTAVLPNVPDSRLPVHERPVGVSEAEPAKQPERTAMLAS